MEVTYTSHAEDGLGGINELLNGGKAVVGKVAAVENVSIRVAKRSVVGATYWLAMALRPGHSPRASVEVGGTKA